MRLLQQFLTSVSTVEEEGYRGLASKIIVEEVESERSPRSGSSERSASSRRRPEFGGTPWCLMSPGKGKISARMAASTTKQGWPETARSDSAACPEEEFADLEDPVLSRRVIRFEHSRLSWR